MDERINLAAFAPPRCDYGHRLGPGRILAGWRPCGCTEAIKAGRLGHQTVTCTACLDVKVTTVYLEPPVCTAT
ncbi:MAG TPA: hypothetical protein VFQ44_02255 [Streptosporangiaceae bacterium]|nr:hypothetical protein [Streptosporangiaceae bacterium]